MNLAAKESTASQGSLQGYFGGTKSVYRAWLWERRRCRGCVGVGGVQGEAPHPNVRSSQQWERSQDALHLTGRKKSDSTPSFPYAVNFFLYYKYMMCRSLLKKGQISKNIEKKRKMAIHPALLKKTLYLFRGVHLSIICFLCFSIQREATQRQAGRLSC